MSVVARLTDGEIRPEILLEEFIAGASGAGAVVSFCGLARGTDHAGARVDRLRLDHHPRLTIRSLERIAVEGAARFGISHCLVVHRHGLIRPGETIVFVATASPHRRAAFDAADYLMDRLKTEAVFWKKEESEASGRWIEPTDADRAGRLRWGD